MSRRAHHEVTGAELGFLPVVHDDLHTPGDEVAHVRRLAAIGAGDGLDVLGPLPAGVEGGSPNRAAVEVDQFELARSVFEGPNFFIVHPTETAKLAAEKAPKTAEGGDAKATAKRGAAAKADTTGGGEETAAAKGKAPSKATAAKPATTKADPGKAPASKASTTKSTGSKATDPKARARKSGED